MTVPPPLERLVLLLATSARGATTRPAGLRALMEAEALTTDTWSMQTAPDDEPLVGETRPTVDPTIN